MRNSVRAGGGFALGRFALAFVIGAAGDDGPGAGEQGLEGGLVVDQTRLGGFAGALVRGQFDGLVGAGDIRQGLAELAGLLEQGGGGDVVAGRGVAVDGAGADPQAGAGTDAAPLVAAQLKAFAAEAAAVVVSLMDQVT